MKYHYVYRITNKENNKHYYGVRSSKIKPKLDLGIKYFSSSTDKEFINEQKTNKDKFKYKIIKIFETRINALNLEIYLHKKFEVAKSPNFYNRSKQTSIGFDLGDTHHDGLWKKGFATYISETGEKIRLSVEEANQRMLVAESKGRKYSKEVNIKKGRSGELNSMFGKPLSDSARQKIKDSWYESRPKTQCPYCKKQILKHHNRFHFENCKSK